MKHLSSRRDFMRRVGLGSAALALGPYAAGRAAAASATKPNFVFIHVDDLDFDEIGAYAGAGKVWTPHLDRLVGEGLKFTNGYVTCPVCVPSRFSTITGRHIGRNRYNARHIPPTQTLDIENSTRGRNPITPPFIEDGEMTFAHLMKQAGYATGMVGKWHNDRASLSRDLKKASIEGDPRDPEVAARVRADYEETRRRVRKESGFDYVERLYAENKEQLPCPDELKAINSPWITEGAVEFIDRNKDRPFFLYYSSPIPHGQMVQPVRFPDRKAEDRPLGHHIKKNLAGDKALATPAGYLEKVPDVQPGMEDLLARFWKNAPDAHPNAAFITWLDDSVGAILERLRRHGLEENTVVFLLSDHQSVDKFSPYARGANVPFAVRWKGHIPAGSVSDSLVASLDITATMRDLAGHRPPANVVLDGVSMAPLFADPDATVRDDLLIEFGYARSIVTRQWQYVALRFPDDVPKPTREKPLLHTGGKRKNRAEVLLQRHPGAFDPDQLYDLTADPGQERNLWGKPGNDRLEQDMQRRLKNYLSQFPHSFGEFAQHR